MKTAAEARRAHKDLPGEPACRFPLRRADLSGACFETQSTCNCSNKKVRNVMTLVRKISSETTVLPGIEITLDVYRDPDGEHEDCALLHLVIGDGAALVDSGPIARECPLPELAVEIVNIRHGYTASTYCANGEDRCASKLDKSLPGMITPTDGQIRAWPLYPDGGTDGDDSDHFSEAGLRLSISRFADAYRKRLEWVAARRANTP
jgi:hypothetical protein